MSIIIMNFYFILMEETMNFFSEGNKLYNSQDYLRAIDCYKRAVSKKENEACSYYNAGVCFIKLKDYDNAITMIQNALSLQKDSPDTRPLCYARYLTDDTYHRKIGFLKPLSPPAFSVQTDL